jgi:lipid-A-disaccharide synthase-like uncharacterized protein
MLLSIITKGLGVVGLLLITLGIFIKDVKKRDKIYIIGGSALLLYSAYLKDPIFIPLQVFFILSSIYHIHTIKKKRFIFF